MNKFTHTKNEVKHGNPEKDEPRFSVGGYEPCKTCGQRPAFKYDSSKPDEIEVITCEHVKEKK